MPSHEFFKPKLSGQRFEDHTIPVEILDDFANYEELLLKLAKWIYYEENDRQRVPKGFGKGVSLKLENIEHGSAIPKMMIVASTFLVQNQDTLHYFEEAREKIVKAVDAANRGVELTGYLPSNLFYFFDKIGKRLLEDESIDFKPGSLYNAKLTTTSRLLLALASPQLQTVEGVGRAKGLVSALDKKQKTFTVLEKDDSKVIVKLEDEFSEIIFDAFERYENQSKVLVKGIGRFNRQAKLQNIDSIRTVTILHDLDVESRLEEFLDLGEGWLDGDGSTYRRPDIDWLIDKFENQIPQDIVLPYTYPTPDGGIQFEWKRGVHDATLTISLNDKSAYLHYFNSATDEEIENEALNLNNDSSWEWAINTILNPHFKIQ